MAEVALRNVTKRWGSFIGVHDVSLDIAMVFQNYGLYPNLTVYENIRFPLKVRKIDPSTHDARVKRADDMVELGDLLGRRPRELSGGPLSS